MSQANSSESIEALAADIGEAVYIDVAKWHLYLNDAHLHTIVAERLYPLLESGTLQEEKVVDVLRSILVKLGGGQREVPLADLVPMQCQMKLIDILEDFQNK
jgi:hypothetical protein